MRIEIIAVLEGPTQSITEILWCELSNLHRIDSIL